MKNPEAKWCETTLMSSTVKCPSLGNDVTLLTSACWNRCSAFSKGIFASAAVSNNAVATAWRYTLCAREKPASRENTKVLTRKSTLEPFRKSVVGVSISNADAKDSDAASGSFGCAS